MTILEWKEEYGIQIKDIDKQHKQLINLINELYQAMKDRKTKEALGKIIAKLAAYALNHFSTEEIYFDQYRYPDAAEHIAEHKGFIDKVSEFKTSFDQGKLFPSEMRGVNLFIPE